MTRLPVTRPPLTGDVHQTWPGKRWWQKPGPWCRTKARLRIAAHCGPALATIPASPAARVTIWAVGAYAVWQGAGIAIGGDQRWGSPSFAALRTMPNPTLTWGLLLVVFGVAVLTASWLRVWALKAVGLCGLAVWSLLFALGALEAAAAIPTHTNTAGKTYCLIALVAVILISIDESHPIGSVDRRTDAA